MERSLLLSFPFRRAEIPKEEIVAAEILGVDDGSYFHISFSDSKIDDLYGEMLEKIRACVFRRCCMPYRLSVNAGVDCIVEYPGRRGGAYARGKTIESIPGTETIKCELVDDVLEVEIHRSQIFYTNAAVMDYPKFSLKCKLAGMESFIGHPHLKSLYDEFMKGEWKPGSNQCTVQVLDRNHPIPSVRLCMISGKDLSCMLQQFLPIVGRTQYPMFGVPFKAKITHCDEKGQVWFQHWDKMSLLGVVKSILALYTDGYLRSLSKMESPPVATWMEHYLSDPGKIFVYLNLDGDKSYRVRVLGHNFNGTLKVFYVDYGETENVRADRLTEARLIDPMLCLIPPQCLSFRFIGAACTDDNSNVFNLRKFWKYVLLHQPVSIVLKEFNNGPRLPAFVPKDLAVPAHYVDPCRVNLFPPPGIPENFLYESLAHVSQQFTSQNFWAYGNQLVVASVPEDQATAMEGRVVQFQGDVIPPEADILVHLDSPEDPLKEPGYSLFAIYHTLGTCNVHGPVKSWDPRGEVALQDNFVNLNLDRGLQHAAVFGSTYVMPAIRSGNPQQYTNWVDWAVGYDKCPPDENNNWWTATEALSAEYTLNYLQKAMKRMNHC